MVVMLLLDTQHNSAGGDINGFRFENYMYTNSVWFLQALAALPNQLRSTLSYIVTTVNFIVSNE